MKKNKICPEYISKRNFNTKNQIILSKITDGDKWHFLALPSISYEDGVKRPTKSLSRLMEGISSKKSQCFLLLRMFTLFLHAINIKTSCGTLSI